MTKVLSTLGLISLLFLSSCKEPEPSVIREVCVFLKDYLVVAKKTDHLDTKRASKKQIDFYLKWCK